MIKVERLAHDLSEVIRLPYSQCLATVRRRAKHHGYRREIPVSLANQIVSQEFRAARAKVQPPEALLVI